MNLTSATQRSSLYSLKNFYLVCVVFSVVVSWGIFAQFLFTSEASLSEFFRQAFTNPVSTLVSSDILISAPIFLIFAYRELKRVGMPVQRLWLYILTTLSVGICGSLSLFLYQRERWLTQK